MSQPNLTPVYIDRDIDNVKILEKVMAEEKGIVQLKGCVLAAIDFFVQQRKNNQSKTESQANSSQ